MELKDLDTSQKCSLSFTKGLLFVTHGFECDESNLTDNSSFLAKVLISSES